MNAEAVDPGFLERFEADGFAALRGCIAGGELETLLANVDRFIREVVPGMPRERIFCEDNKDSATLKQIQHMGDHDAWMRDLFTRGRFRRIAEGLLLGPVVPKNMQYFNKPPGVGRPTPPHQDGSYFMLQPCEAVTMWLALDEADEENGCVRFVRGSHRRGLREHARTGTLGFSRGIADYPTEEDRRNEVARPASPGDLLVHQAMTIHRADANRSAARSRRALGFIYYSERAREDTAAHEAYQRRLADEMRSAGKL